MNPYEEQLDQLKQDDIDKLEVPHSEFFTFREAWIQREDKKFYRGEAHIGGSVTYTYDTTVV